MAPRRSRRESHSNIGAGSDSDSDLDLHEISHHPPLYQQHRAHFRQVSSSNRFAGPPVRLRNLQASQGPRHDRISSVVSVPASDLQGLGDSIDGDRSIQSTIGEDDSPLLPIHNSPRKPKKQKSTFMARLWNRAQNFNWSGGQYGSIHDLDVDQDPGEVASFDLSLNSARTVEVGNKQQSSFPPNAISNAKYTLWSFLPLTLYNEFSFFFNLYFLFVALSQIIPPLRIGYLSTYIAPLAFVLSISIGKEALDDIARRRRDSEANSETYTVLSFENFNSSISSRADRVRETIKPSRNIKVGDVVQLKKDQRVPADVIILKCTAAKDLSASGANLVDSVSGGESETGEAFIRTDQLDGETDWKLRLASHLSQELELQDFCRLKVTAGKPDRRVNTFVGTMSLQPETQIMYSEDDPEFSPITQTQSVPLNIDHTAWANTVIASSGIVYAVVVYTGPETRQALSSSPSRSKTGLLEYELNSLTKILCFLTLFLSVVLVALQGFEPTESERVWYVSVMRYLILFSTIVPVSLRVNIDMAKSVYAWLIEHDKSIPGTVVRTSTIPEDLGRIEYLLSDKTGTLTQNEMEMKKVHVGTVSYANDAMEEVSDYVHQAFVQSLPGKEAGHDMLATPSMAHLTQAVSSTRTRREIGSRVRDLVWALAICHNVTPTTEIVNGESVTTYQASSPDEIAIVKWTERMGLRLVYRDRTTIVLSAVGSGKEVCRARILHVFPFTSEGKRMGILVHFLTSSSLKASIDLDESSEIWFYQKGADSVMSTIVMSNDWLDEETANMAREGLRTLVVGRKQLSLGAYQDFLAQYEHASRSMEGRDAKLNEVVLHHLEHDLELLGVTGVEDKLQKDVKPALELLRNAGVKIWMLTGDKVETARCIAVSSKLVSRNQTIHTVSKVTRKDQALSALSAVRKDHASSSLNPLRSRPDFALLIDGDSLAVMLAHHRQEFISIAVELPAVICCRCSPTQKADVARLIRAHTRKRVACIGDGGNDVSMIQAADVGIGIVGKEGRQASLAADFSILQFCHLTKLLVWHGRNSYKRSANLALFVMHRGLIFAVCQTVYSIASSFEPIALFRDWLLVGYATVYTMVPVFSLVLDRDVDEKLASLYPELYKELTGKGQPILGYRNFLIWIVVSVYQGSIIQGVSQLLVGLKSDAFNSLVAVSFTALILNELLMVAAAITTWHWVMAVSILGTAGIFFGSFPFLGEYFDLQYVISPAYVWKTVVVLALAVVPPYFAKLINRTVRPPNYRKVQQAV